MPANTTILRGNLLPTPPLPADLPSIELTGNSRKVLEKRYLRRGEDGNPIETIDEMFWRVAYHIARVEEAWDVDVIALAREYYQLMVSRQFFPNSPTFTGAGTPLGQLAACFVLPISDDMGRKSTGIFQTLRDAALIQQTGGGNGFSFSRLRPVGALVKSSAGKATGPVGFLRVYDHAFGEVAQGGSRRGANMAVVRVDHPDIEDFISCKANENHITNFNISVGITDAFMIAVENDDMWELRFPDVHHPDYREFNGTIEDAEAAGIPLRVYKRIPARELFDKIVEHAHHNGEPGVLFLDAANRANPLSHLYQLESTNPCGEQWLGPYESCCLGSLNLSQFIDPEGTVDWDKLRQQVELATRFLDDVVDANKYVPAVPQIEQAAKNSRRIGLGIMGLADLMYHSGIRYGSADGQEFAAQVMEFIRYHAMRASIDLAKTRGCFKTITGSIYDPANLTWTPPVPIEPYQCTWGRPELDWDLITAGIRENGIRNAAQTTVAPTGTIATVAGCEGYGCEPVFALAYIRHVNDNGKDLTLTYTSPQFAASLDALNLEPEKKEEIINQIMEEGTCQNIEALPEEMRNTFVVSSDITAEEHVYMQAALQAFVDNSLSKTVNFPATATPQDVATAYMLAWKLQCRGTTVYVTGSRDTVVLETKATAEKKNGESQTAAAVAAVAAHVETYTDEEMDTLWQETKKPRPRSLVGFTYQVPTPLGKAFITINENGGSQPFEVFINTAKAGSDTAAVSEAIGRLISYVLRLSSPILPIERLQDVSRQLTGIGGGRAMGFGPNRVRSLPDGIAQILKDYLQQWQDRENGGSHRKVPKPNTSNGAAVTGATFSLDMGQLALPVEPLAPQAPKPKEGLEQKIGDLCPECGVASLVNEEGCRKCYSCGYSEC